jgi:uncharacterized membrane protein YgcG
MKGGCVKTKFSAFLLAALLLAGTAWAQPTISPVVSDTANVLDASLIEGIADINRQTERELAISYRVITKHFLGGAQAISYARETRESYANPDQIILLVMVIGEERYAVSIGSAAQALISQDAMDSLLASAFRLLFLNRDYSGALAAFTAQLAGQMQNASGKVIDASMLYAGAALVPSPSADPLDGFFREPAQSMDHARRYQEETEEAQRGDRGLSIWQIALIGFVLFKIFGRNRRTGQKRGCGPLGWIFGTWGISKFFGWRK